MPPRFSPFAPSPESDEKSPGVLWTIVDRCMRMGEACLSSSAATLLWARQVADGQAGNRTIRYAAIGGDDGEVVSRLAWNRTSNKPVNQAA